MTILHITNDFSLTKVHSNLCKALDTLSIEQIIYNPVRENTPVGNNNIDFKKEESKILYSKELRKYHRILFRNKIGFLFKDLESKVTLNKISVIHASTLFSDGAVALKINKKHGTPFLVAVRSTDIDLFLKYRPDLIFIALQIVKRASKIIFISKALKRAFLEHYLIKPYAHKLEHKCVIVYNGIDKYWLDNQEAKKAISPTKILYVGRFIHRKNLINLASAVVAMNAKGLPCELNLAGSGGAAEAALKELSIVNKGLINLLGYFSDNVQLKEIYKNNHIFAMPSDGETFGLVYIEALSQGLPVLYSPNEGIDEVFSYNIGEKCNGRDIMAIAEKLEKMINNYSSYQLDKIDFSIFRWEYIAKIYLDMYTKTLKR